MVHRGGIAAAVAAASVLAASGCGAELPPELLDFYRADGLYDFPAGGMVREPLAATLFSQLDVAPPARRRGRSAHYLARFDFIAGDLACSFSADFLGEGIFFTDTVPLADADCLLFTAAGPALSITGTARLQVDPDEHLEVCIEGSATSPTASGVINILLAAYPE